MSVCTDLGVLAAIAHLQQVDEALKTHIDALGDCDLKPSKYPFDVLVRSIIGQQLSAKAAETITIRLEVAIGHRRPFVPRQLLSVPEQLIVDADRKLTH
jgi:DNA-3-methyladenine glycosylase II